MRFAFVNFALFAIFFISGCSSGKTEPVSVRMEIWDCRYDPPKRIDGSNPGESDFLTPNFSMHTLLSNGGDYSDIVKEQQKNPVKASE